MAVPQININLALRESWLLTRSHTKLLLGAMLIYLALEGLLVFLTSQNYHIPTYASTPLKVVLAVAEYVLSLGLYRVALCMADGKSVRFETLWKVPIVQAIRVFFAGILVGFMAALGTLFFVVPGIYLALRFSQVKYLILDRNLGVWEAMDASSRMTVGIKWSLFGFYLVCIFIILFSIVVLVVPVLIALPAVVIAQVLVYRQLLGSIEEVPGAGPSPAPPASLQHSWY